MQIFFDMEDITITREPQGAGIAWEPHPEHGIGQVTKYMVSSNAKDRRTYVSDVLKTCSSIKRVGCFDMTIEAKIEKIAGKDILKIHFTGKSIGDLEDPFDYLVYYTVNTSSPLQDRLNQGETPLQIVRSGVDVNSLYGLEYKDGLIFFVDKDDIYPNLEGIVISKQNIEGPIYGNFRWGCDGQDISTLRNLTSDEHKEVKDLETIDLEGCRVGDGLLNTIAIISGCTESNDNLPAAKGCKILGEDWYLPSLGEWKLINKNLCKNGVCGLDEMYYWTSTESSKDNVISYKPKRNITYQGKKTGYSSTRAVRYF